MNLEPGDLGSSLFPHTVMTRKSFDFSDPWISYPQKWAVGLWPPSVPFNLKIQSVNLFFPSCLLLVWVHAHWQEEEVKTNFVSWKRFLFNWGVSESPEEIMQMICCSESAELPWGEIQKKTQNPGKIVCGYSCSSHPFRHQNSAYLSVPIYQLLLPLSSWVELELLATILRFILE